MATIKHYALVARSASMNAQWTSEEEKEYASDLEEMAQPNKKMADLIEALKKIRPLRPDKEESA